MISPGVSMSAGREGKLERRREALRDATLRVSEKAREISDDAVPNGAEPASTYSVSAYLIDELREALQEARDATEQALRTIAGRADDECASCGALPHQGPCARAGKDVPS